MARSTYSTGVCENGHLERTSAKHEGTLRCSKCGAVVLTKCPNCGSKLQRKFSDYNWKRGPSICEHCGITLPWAGKDRKK